MKKRRRGFELTEDRSVREFGDRAITTRSSSLVVKLVSERSRWSISVRGVQWTMGFSPYEWDAERESRPLGEPFWPLAEQATYLLEHLDRIGAEAGAASRDLERRLREQRSAYNTSTLGLDEH